MQPSGRRHTLARCSFQTAASSRAESFPSDGVTKSVNAGNFVVGGDTKATYHKNNLSGDALVVRKHLHGDIYETFFNGSGLKAETSKNAADVPLPVDFVLPVEHDRLDLNVCTVAVATYALQVLQLERRRV